MSIIDTLVATSIRSFHSDLLNEIDSTYIYFSHLFAIILT